VERRRVAADSFLRGLPCAPGKCGVLVALRVCNNSVGTVRARGLGFFVFILIFLFTFLFLVFLPFQHFFCFSFFLLDFLLVCCWVVLGLCPENKKDKSCTEKQKKNEKKKEKKKEKRKNHAVPFSLTCSSKKMSRVVVFLVFVTLSQEGGPSRWANTSANINICYA